MREVVADKMQPGSKRTSRPKKTTPRQRAILVLGMHRSGTSATAGAIAQLGASLPANLLPPTRDNPKGYWESRDLMNLHDQVFESVGLEWLDSLSFPDLWNDSSSADTYLKKLRHTLNKAFPKDALIVVKDPRICKITPFWLKALAMEDIEPLVVIPMRNPLEVAQSLNQRDGIPIAVGCLLWLQHLVDAEAATRKITRSFLLFDELIENRQLTLEKVARDLSISWPRADDPHIWQLVDQLIQPNLKRQSASQADLQSDPKLASLFSKTYEAAKQLCASPFDKNAFKQLDSARIQLNKAERLFGPAVTNKLELLNTSKADLKSTRDRVADLQRDITGFKQKIDSVKGELSATEAQRKALQQRVLDLEHELEIALHNINQLNQTISRLNGTIDNQAQQISELAEQLRWQHEAYAELSNAHQQRIEAQHAEFIQGWRLQKEIRQLNQPLAKKWISALKPGSKGKQLQALADLISASQWFDADWYRETYLDVSGSTINPARHYLGHGVDEGRDPSPHFQTVFYLMENPDVYKSGVNPLVHFITHGENEGREPTPGEY